MTSTNSSILIRLSTNILSVDSIICTAFSGNPDLISASVINFPKYLLELIVSLPPLKIMALPALIANEAESMVTLGLDS